MENEYGAVITAAGLSSRMGEFKPLKLLNGAPLIEHVINRFLRAGVREIAVITGYRAEDLKKIRPSEEIVFLHNSEYRNNDMFASVRLGLEYFRDLCGRVFITPSDVPLFRVSTLFEEMKTDAPVVIPEYRGRGGHPVLTDSGAIGTLLSFNGGNGLKGAFSSLKPGSVVRLPVDDPGCVMDADTREDFELLRHLAETDQERTRPMRAYLRYRKDVTSQ